MDALRYLNDGLESAVQDVTITGDYAYTWKEFKLSNRLEAFWIGQPLPPQAKSGGPWSERLASAFRDATPAGAAVRKVPSIRHR
jgi:hypothetical protein